MDNRRSSGAGGQPPPSSGREAQVLFRWPSPATTHLDEEDDSSPTGWYSPSSGNSFVVPDLTESDEEEIASVERAAEDIERARRQVKGAASAAAAAATWRRERKLESPPGSLGRVSFLREDTSLFGKVRRSSPPRGIEGDGLPEGGAEGCVAAESPHPGEQAD